MKATSKQARGASLQPKRPPKPHESAFAKQVREFYQTIGTPVYPLPVGEWHLYDLSDATATSSASEALSAK